jgi:hypothetical protein
MTSVIIRGFVLLAAILPAVSPAAACGPVFSNAVFVINGGPDSPDTFNQGKLGIVLSSYGPAWLLSAYRQLNSIGFGNNELEKLFPRQETEQPEAHQEFRAWLTDRSAIPGVAPAYETKPYRYVEESYMEYLNCNKDAFTTARKTLRARVEDYGPLSQELQAWVTAQDQVFANCSGTEAVIPVAALPDSRPLVKADRDYQIAAALFYSRRFDEAEQKFRSIAADTASPWRERAPYLAARALIRKGTLVGENRDFNRELLAAAEKDLQAILKADGSRQLHEDARGLLNFVRFRLYPVERLTELSNLLAKPSDSPALGQEFLDFQLLTYRQITGALTQVDPVVLRTDLTDWIASLRSTGAATEQHVFQRWQQKRNTLWLMAALVGVSSGHPGVGELLKAASVVPESDPGYDSVTFYRAKLMAELGKSAEARTLLRSLAGRMEKQKNASAVNLIRAELLEMAESLDDFLLNVPRMEAWETNGDSSQAGNPDIVLFDDDAARQLNWGMPLTMLQQAALKDLPVKHLRAELLLAATVRAMLLERPEVVRSTAPRLAKLLPNMKPVLDDYLQATTNSDREFSAAVLMLKFPGALPYIASGLRIGDINNIDSYSEKWWCDVRDPAEKEPKAAPLRIYPRFVSAAEQREAAQEREAFLDLDTALNELTERVIKRVKSSPEDQRLPEALHLVIVYARNGCSDEDTRTLSKEAFQLLHKKYPRSNWAKKTKYWY